MRLVRLWALGWVLLARIVDDRDGRRRSLVDDVVVLIIIISIISIIMIVVITAMEETVTARQSL